MSERPKSSLGPWLFDCVTSICIVVLVVTGHEEFVGRALATAFILALILFALCCI